MKKMYLIFLLALLLFQSCSSTNKTENQENYLEHNELITNAENNIFQNNFEPDKEVYNKVFPWIKDSTYYRNPTLLVQKLGEYYGQSNLAQTAIIDYQRQHLYGLMDSVWFLNCKTTEVVKSCVYPTFHTQYVFDKEGKLIYKSNAAFAQFVPIMPDSIPLYMTIEHDCEGNGEHHFYRYQSGEMIDIFNVLMTDSPKTVDANPNGGMFQNNFLNLVVNDLDGDGYNDITLKGKWLILENETGKKFSPSNPFKTNNIEYNFLYKPTKEYFLLEK